MTPPTTEDHHCVQEARIAVMERDQKAVLETVRRIELEVCGKGETPGVREELRTQRSRLQDLRGDFEACGVRHDTEAAQEKASREKVLSERGKRNWALVMLFAANALILVRLFLWDLIEGLL